MNWARFGWEDVRKPVTTDRIRQIEKRLGVTFPADYRECFRLYHGATPERRSVFQVPHPDIPFMSSSVAVLLNATERGDSSLIDTYRDLKDQLPSGVIPIADDGGGDFVCLHYGMSTKRGPAIVYWSHEEGRVFKLANTFSAFMSNLRE